MIKKFFNSSHPLIIILIVIICVLMLFCFHLMNSSSIYMFNGSNDDIRITNGIISVNDRIGVFEGSDIEYLTDDIKLKSYKIGYYVLIKNEYIPVCENESTEDDLYSLKGLLMEGLSFNVSESRSSDHYFTKDNVKALKRALYFKVSGIDENDKEVNISIKLDIVKI